MSADHITFARPANGQTTLAKIIRVEGGRIVGKDPSPQVKLFEFAELPVHDLDSLGEAVMRMAERGAIAVRGKPKGPIGRRAIYSDAEKGPAGLEVVPRRWVGFDWDGLPLELQPCPNPKWSWEPHPLLEPWIGAQIALRRLPPQFREVSCFWQVSAGAGFDPGFRLRTWHWLDYPLTGAELKVWLKPAIDRKLVDPVTLVEAQPHYLGVRVAGGPDPCPQRFGFLRLAKQEVIVPDIAGIKRRQEEIERAKRPPEQPSRRQVSPDYAQQRIDECLAAIRSSANGARHPTYVTEAARAKAICDKHGVEWAPVRRDLINAYESTLTAAEANRRRKSSTLDVVAWLERRAG
jgi:hypothetical protein